VAPWQRFTMALAARSRRLGARQPYSSNRTNGDDSSRCIGRIRAFWRDALGLRTAPTCRSTDRELAGTTELGRRAHRASCSSSASASASGPFNGTCAAPGQRRQPSWATSAQPRHVGATSSEYDSVPSLRALLLDLRRERSSMPRLRMRDESVRAAGRKHIMSRPKSSSRSRCEARCSLRRRTHVVGRARRAHRGTRAGHECLR